MAVVSMKALRKQLNASIAEQEKWNGEQAKWKAEQDKWNAEHAKWKAEQEKRDAERKVDFERQQAEYEKGWKKLQQDLGRLGHSYGDQVEAMFVNLGAKFNDKGYSFPKEAKVTTFRDKNRRVVAEVDRLLENGNVILAVEVKAKLKKDDIDDHMERLGKISKHIASLGDGRKVLGAVAGGIVPQNLLDYAQKKGLFVLVQNGEAIKLRNHPKTLRPKSGRILVFNEEKKIWQI